MTLPGRGPLTAAERATALARSQPVATGDGLIQTRRSERRNGRSQPAKPAAAGAIVASAQYTDLSPGGFVSAFDVSNLAYSQGAVGDYFSYGFQMNLLLVGWYQVSASATVSGATAGDLLSVDVTLGPGTEDTVLSWATAATGVSIDLTAQTLPFYVSEDDMSFSANVVNAHCNNYGSGAGSLSSVRMTLVAFA